MQDVLGLLHIIMYYMIQGVRRAPRPSLKRTLGYIRCIVAATMDTEAFDSERSAIQLSAEKRWTEGSRPTATKWNTLFSLLRPRCHC
jgi:hypothetical protein